MFKERLQEILEFTKSESPYKKANKGWINQDIFLEFGKSFSKLSKQKEAAKVTLLWPPIQSLIFNLFLIIIISSLIVLTALKQSESYFNLSSFNVYLKNQLVQLYDKESNLVSEEDKNIESSLNSYIEEDFNKEEINEYIEGLSETDVSLTLEANIPKDEISELGDKSMEEIDIKNDISIITTKKPKSNFF